MYRIKDLCQLLKLANIWVLSDFFDFSDNKEKTKYLEISYYLEDLHD
jgi:hypothetical protein